MWANIRLLGSIIIIAGAMMNHTQAVLIGLFVQYIGLFGAVNRLERQVESLLPKEKEDAGNRDK